MKQEIVMRGQTASGGTEVLEFSGIQIENKNMAYKLVEFVLYPSTNIFSQAYEMAGSITAGKTAIAPTDPNFDNEGLLATCFIKGNSGASDPIMSPELSIVNDTFLITQNLILMVQDGQSTAVNWQCRFQAVKMTDAEMAGNNFKQYMISDGS